jgi:hypothetical protein
MDMAIDESDGFGAAARATSEEAQTRSRNGYEPKAVC